MTVAEARRWGAEMLSGLESPRLEADLLLLHVLRWPRHRLILGPTLDLTRHQLEEYRQAVSLRRRRTPLQHITGRVEFMSLDLACGPEALVPRPETEVMVTTLLELLPGDSGRLLDVGTGSGAVAVVLAARRPSCTVVATDIDRAALGLAQTNAALHDLHNVGFVACDLASALFGGFQGVAANLPYVASEEMAGLQPEVRLGDPAVALDGGPDGLEQIRRLAADLPRLLAPGGAFALEISHGQAREVAGMLERHGLTGIGVRRDMAGRNRVVFGRREL